MTEDRLADQPPRERADPEMKGAFGQGFQLNFRVTPERGTSVLKARVLVGS